MAGQKPNDFIELLNLNGNEEFYTQVGDNPRRFSMNTLVGYLEDNLSPTGGTNYWSKNSNGVYNDTDSIGIGRQPDATKSLAISGETLIDFLDDFGNIYQVNLRGGADVGSSNKPIEFKMQNKTNSNTYANLSVLDCSGDITDINPCIILESFKDSEFTSLVVANNSVDTSTINPINYGFIKNSPDNVISSVYNFVTNEYSEISIFDNLIKLFSRGASIIADSSIEFNLNQLVVSLSSDAYPFTNVTATLFKYAGGVLGQNSTMNINFPTYSDNAAALLGGLIVNDVYKTNTGELRVVI